MIEITGNNPFASYASQQAVASSIYEPNVIAQDGVKDASSIPLEGKTIEKKKQKRSFEDIRKDLAKFLIKRNKQKRKNADRLSHALEKHQDIATAQHAATFRTNFLIFMTAAKCALEAASVFAIAFPQVPYSGCESLNRVAGFDVFSIGRFKGDMNEFSDDAAKLFQSLASTTETVKQLFETRHAGDRTEIAALEAKLKTFFDKRLQDTQQAGREEDEALRDLQQIHRQESELRSILSRA